MGTRIRVLTRGVEAEDASLPKIDLREYHLFVYAELTRLMRAAPLVLIKPKSRLRGCIPNYT